MHKRHYDKGSVKLWSMAKNALFSGRWFCGVCPRFSGRWFVVWGFSIKCQTLYTQKKNCFIFIIIIPSSYFSSSPSSSSSKVVISSSSFPVSGTTLFSYLLLVLPSTSFSSGAISEILCSPNLLVVTSFIASMLSSVFAFFQCVYSWYNQPLSIRILWELSIF